MNLTKWTSQERGRASQLARMLSVSSTTVANWISGKKPIPPERCPAIERATVRAVTCEELRPDVDWEYLRGTAAIDQAKSKSGADIFGAPPTGHLPEVSDAA
ncbi:transcriptional regulator [Xylella fastidiosa]|uniref:Cro/Cl family transcriptional regulator n=1 Tax=Xylella fastidiosa subsp. sandyi Ann-1 TaxID=155920 RepID=A0A060H9E4_XYLFS|nr:helix-turn-helix domain-containing protein [Xylella fastidiosa]AIC09986.1 Cro/Cl family transcriptional regulator [Xylella fastidiosa subsp. sandyi Ann-1]